MPKMKTKRGAAKRLKKTGSGKLLKRQLREAFWRGRKTKV